MCLYLRLYFWQNVTFPYFADCEFTINVPRSETYSHNNQKMSGTPSFNHELAVRAWSLMNSGTAQRIGFSELREKLRDQVLIQTFENQLKEVFHLTALGWTMADRTKVSPTRALPRLAQPTRFLFRM
jgi:hypothetical protein